MVLSDAAHSIGAFYQGKHTGALTDVSVFSFHAVKNLTTAEGGAIALNFPAPFNNAEIYKTLCISTLHGQNKDALAKMQKGNWKYDVIEPGYKCNMTDIMAAIGLVELERYDREILPRRKIIMKKYHEAFKAYSWAELPPIENEEKVNEVIKGNYFLYYFIRAAKNNVASNTSPFHKNVRIKDNMFIDNIDIEDLTDIELKIEKENKFLLIDRNYTRIPKTYFQDLLWSKYFIEGKTHRQIGKELEISHCLSFHEIRKIKEELVKKIKSDLNK
jgi:hypothetical protein